MRPVFVIMLVESATDATCIEFARDVGELALRYKRGQKRAKSGKGRAPAADWRLELWIGPFTTMETAKMFAELWQFNTNDVGARRKRAHDLAVQYSLTCYTMRPDLLLMPAPAKPAPKPRTSKR